MAVKLGLVLAIACTLCVHAYAQASTSGCTSVLISLSSCLSYITGNATKPASSCCSQLDTVVKSQPQCLCLVLGSNNTAASLGIKVNQTKALSLPVVCNVNTPNPSLCGAITGSPIASPTTPNSALPTQQSTTTTSPLVNGTKTTPAAIGPSTTTTNGSPMGSAPSLMAMAVIFLVSSAFASF